MTDDITSRRYRRAVVTAQASSRIPAVSVAIHRADRALWTCEVGMSGRDDAPLGPRSQFRCGSISKTFTATLVMRCRDAGLIDLDDEIGKHLPLPRYGDMTIRRLISHTAGLQREAVGNMWDNLAAPDEAQLLADMAEAERVLPNSRRYHYSNLGAALLGMMVSRLRGASYDEVLTEEILTPLGLSGTSVQPSPTAVVGYLVDEYSDHARPEPATDLGATGAAGQLWSTAADMAKWGAFLVNPDVIDPDGRVLAPATLDEMRWPLTPMDEVNWAASFGLGLLLMPQPNRVMHVGHDGAMPGFLAATYGRRGGEGNPGALAVAVLGSSGIGRAAVTLPHDLLNLIVEIDPAEPMPWTPGSAAPPEFQSVLGRWWSEGYEHIFGWFDGHLTARMAIAPAGAPPSVFEEVGPDVLRTVSGRETGELLQLTRDRAGAVVKMHWATYPFTRDQQTFDHHPASQP
jgi:CubicO group peptidase (beta-lactamase class C family)